MGMTNEEVTGILGALNLISSAAVEFKKLDVVDKMSMLDRSLKERAIELEASKSMYNENMKLYHDSLNKLDNLESTYGESVGSLDALGELYTASGKDVTADIYEGKATNYQARADNALENLQAIKNKIGILQNVLYTDVKRAKNIMAGGAGFEGGVDEKQWDLGDLGLVSYEAQFGEASETVKNMFANNPGVMVKSLAGLQKTEQALNLTGKKIAYYDEQTKDKDTKKAQAKSDLFFGTLLNNAGTRSGKLQYDGLKAMEANLGEDEQEQIKVYQENRMTILAATGEGMAILLGREISDEDKFDLAQEFHEMHDLSRATSEVRLGKTGYGDLSVFNNYVQEAKNNYQAALKSGDNEKAKQLNELAKIYFGMPLGSDLTSFSSDVAEQFTNTALSEFSGSNNLIDDDNEIPSLKDLKNLEDTEWKELLE